MLGQTVLIDFVEMLTGDGDLIPARAESCCCIVSISLYSVNFVNYHRKHTSKPKYKNWSTMYFIVCLSLWKSKAHKMVVKWCVNYWLLYQKHQSLSLSLEFLNTEQKALLKNATGFKLPKSSEATNCHFKVCPHSGLLYLVQSWQPSEETTAPNSIRSYI